MGDLNARVGSENYSRESTVGKHGVGAMSDNRERLCDFCETNRITVGGTQFQHKAIHKLTCKSPDGKQRARLTISSSITNGRDHSMMSD